MLAVQFVGIVVFVSFFSNSNASTDITLYISSGAVVIIIFLYSIFGGLKKDILTDVIQVIFIFLGVGAIVLFGNMAKDISSLTASFSSTDLSLKGKYNFIFLVGVLLFVPATFFARYDIWQRIFTAKDNSTAKNSFYISGFIAMLFFCFFGCMGLYARAMNIDVSNDQFVALEVINSRLAGIPFALAFIAFFAAVMSSADTFLGAASLSLMKLFPTPHNDSTDQRNRFRIVSLIVGIAAILISLCFFDIIELFSIAFGILMVFLPTIFVALFRKTPQNMESFLSILLGLTAFCVGVFYFPKEAFVLSLIVSAFVYFFVYIFVSVINLNRTIS